jgi:AraC-like DNA-binding protein
LELPNLQLLHAREVPQRIAYVSLPPDRIFLSFLTRRAAPLVYNGAAAQWGEIVLHSPGERFHQRTTTASTWGAISLAPSTLISYGRVLIGRDLAIPFRGQILRLRSADHKELVRLHTQAARLAETALDHLANPEVTRALENDLIVALVTCLVNCDARDGSVEGRRPTAILMQLEDILAASSQSALRVPEICRAIGVSEQVLRACCAKVLGVSAVRYVRLRQLKQIRSALLRADDNAEATAEVISRFGFADLNRFATTYRRAFGKTPMLK